MKKLKPYSLNPEYLLSKPQKGDKITLKELNDLKEYVLNQKVVEPNLVADHQMADTLNEEEKKIKKFYPAYRRHHWRPGDKAYIIMMRGDFGLIGVPEK